MVTVSCTRRLLRRAGLLVVTTSIVLVVSEAFVRALVPVRNVGPSFTTFDETYGIALKKDFTCERITPEFTMRFTTNSDGYRGTTGKRGSVLFLGDSFTMGYGVHDGEEFPAVVDEKLGHNVGIVNAGIGGTGNGRWISFLDNEAPSLAPSAVVLQLCGNDFVDNVREQWFSVDEAGELARNTEPIERSMKRRVQSVVEAVPGLPYSYLLGMMRDARLPRAAVVHAPGSHSPAVDTTHDEVTWLILQAAIDRCEQRGWPVIVVAAAVEEARLITLRELVAERGVELVEVPSKAERPDLYYEVDGHWNAGGHWYTAHAVVDALTK